jgi:hypothetical protein
VDDAPDVAEHDVVAAGEGSEVVDDRGEGHEGRRMEDGQRRAQDAGDWTHSP